MFVRKQLEQRRPKVFGAVLPLYLGCLPGSFAPWSAVYYYFRRWQRNGLWQTLTDAVNQADRLADRLAGYSLPCLPRQSKCAACAAHF